MKQWILDAESERSQIANPTEIPRVGALTSPIPSQVVSGRRGSDFYRRKDMTLAATRSSSNTMSPSGNGKS